MKHEWKKDEKQFYSPKKVPEVVTIPKFKFLRIKGKGNPNNEDFAKRIEVLYSLSYAIRMMPKQGYTPPGYFEYTVYPLEGIWDLTKEGRKLEELDKDELVYTIMIRQPDFVDEDVVNRALEHVRKKKDLPLLDEVTFEEMEDGPSVQMLHVGPYDDEPRSFKMMKDFIKENGLEIKTLVHREIYLSDTRKVEPDKYRTILRYRVKKS